MKLVLLCYSFFWIFCTSCGDNKSNLPQNSQLFFEKPIVPTNDSLEKVVNRNDTLNYSKLASFYFINHLEGRFLFYAMQMAYKNNFNEAYFHIYYIMVTASNVSRRPKEMIKLMDLKSKSFAIYHLLKSYELGYARAIYAINEVFDNPQPIPSSQLFLDELNKEYSK